MQNNLKVLSSYSNECTFHEKTKIASYNCFMIIFVFCLVLLQFIELEPVSGLTSPAKPKSVTFPTSHGLGNMSVLAQENISIITLSPRNLSTSSNITQNK